jgi:hypothetical protein
LKNIGDWLKLNKLSLNCNKTKAMIFHMPQKTVYYPSLFLENVNIEFVNEFNFLGILFDKHLTWKCHINLIAKKISKTVGILSNLKNILPTSALMNIYNALILPYLNYSALLWQKGANRLLVLQKKAVRAISNVRYNAHTGIIFKTLGLLRCTDICVLQCFKFCYKLEHELLPEYFKHGDIFVRHSSIHSYGTRGTNNYSLPQINHEYAKTSIRYKIAAFFNQMKPEIKSKIYTHSMCGFKIYVKNYLFNQYGSDCNDPNCFSCRG